DGLPTPLSKADAAVSQLISSVYWGMRDTYRIDYTSSSPEKEWRDVCVRIKDRPDLYVLREGGTGYRADKSAYAHLFRMIEDREIRLEAGRRLEEVPDGCDADVLEHLFLGEIRRPREQTTTEDLRWEALAALGRIPGRLSDETLRALGTLATAHQTSPDLREG